MAMVLVVILILVVIVFVLLLVFPQKNFFDKIKRSLKINKEKTPVSAMSSVSQGRGHGGSEGYRRGLRKR